MYGVLCGTVSREILVHLFFFQISVILMKTFFSSFKLAQGKGCLKKKIIIIRMMQLYALELKSMELTRTSKRLAIIFFFSG